MKCIYRPRDSDYCNWEGLESCLGRRNAGTCRWQIEGLVQADKKERWVKDNGAKQHVRCKECGEILTQDLWPKSLILGWQAQGTTFTCPQCRKKSDGDGRKQGA